ncbi:hypothetical protein BDZ97DRAFT_1920976 [Flammula alnicola]|nr:hypothetical protein BDZ97DRAFT_1920976 [Flammula alnicola]
MSLTLFSPSAVVAAVSDPEMEVLSTTAKVCHGEYYLPEFGMAVFNIQGRLYKVHRYFFIRESEVFKSMFGCPPSVEGGKDGDSDEKPIHLPQVTCAEFEALLDFFYYGRELTARNTRRLFGSRTQNILKALPVEESEMTGSNCKKRKQKGGSGAPQRSQGSGKLYDLLSISLRYAFDSIISEVVAAIDSGREGVPIIDPVPKILLALKHDILEHWVKPTFQELVNRPTSLTRDEIKRLGPHKAAIISGRREDRMTGRFVNSSRYEAEDAQNDIPDDFYFAD